MPGRDFVLMQPAAKGVMEGMAFWSLPVLAHESRWEQSLPTATFSDIMLVA